MLKSLFEVIFFSFFSIFQFFSVFSFQKKKTEKPEKTDSGDLWSMDITLRGIKFTCDVKHGSECMRVTLGTKLIINGGLIKAASEHTGLAIKLEGPL